MATFPVVTGDQRAILAANILMIAIPVVAVSLRLLSRRIAKRAFNTSDYLMVAVVLFPTPFIHRATFATSILIGAWAIVTILAGCLICRPISKNWDLLMTDGYCGNKVLSFTVTGAINLVTDIMVLVLPLSNFYKLQVPIQQRAVLVGVFSLGFLTCVVSAVRIHYLSSMDYTDLTFSMKHPNIFNDLEPSAAITLACIPPLRPLFCWSGCYSHTGTALDAKQVSPCSSKSSEKSHRGKGNHGDTLNIPLEHLNNRRDEDDGSSECRLRSEEELYKYTVVGTGHPPHRSSGSNGGSSMMIAESFTETDGGDLDGEKGRQDRSDTQYPHNKMRIMMRHEWDVTKQ
ncbi:integral membrane protein [Apiospora arundinis]